MASAVPAPSGSGMSSIEQTEENLRFMKAFRSLDQRELEAVGRVQEIFRAAWTRVACKNLHPRSVCRDEYQTDLPRLERGLLYLGLV